MKNILFVKFKINGYILLTNTLGKMEFINIIMDRNNLSIVFTPEFFNEYRNRTKIDMTMKILPDTLEFRSDPIVHDIVKYLHGRQIPCYKPSYDEYNNIESKLVLYKISNILKKYINFRIESHLYDCEDYNDVIEIDEKRICTDLHNFLISTKDIDTYIEKKKQFDDALCEYNNLKDRFFEIY